MSRKEKSNAIVDFLASRAGFTREVPLGFQQRLLQGVTPAYESDNGRGAVVFDIYRETEVSGIKVEQAAGLKVLSNKKSIYSPIITTGTEDHISAVVSAAAKGVPIPILIFADYDDSWHFCSYDLSEMVQKYGVQKASEGAGSAGGRGFVSDKPVVYYPKNIRTTYRPRFGPARTYTYQYMQISVNIRAAGLEYRTIDLPEFDWVPFVGTYY